MGACSAAPPRAQVLLGGAGGSQQVPAESPSGGPGHTCWRCQWPTGACAGRTPGWGKRSELQFLEPGSRVFRGLGQVLACDPPGGRDSSGWDRLDPQTELTLPSAGLGQQLHPRVLPHVGSWGCERGRLATSTWLSHMRRRQPWGIPGGQHGTTPTGRCHSQDATSNHITSTAPGPQWQERFQVHGEEPGDLHAVTPVTAGASAPPKVYQKEGQRKTRPRQRWSPEGSLSADLRFRKCQMKAFRLKVYCTNRNSEEWRP